MISGTAQEGQTSTASTGSWSGSPTGHSYQWIRCDYAGAGCVAIPAATSSSYAAQTADVGATMRVAVTASNTAGSATAVSAQTAVVAAAPAPPPAATTQTLTFSDSINQKTKTRSFALDVGAGARRRAAVVLEVLVAHAHGAVECCRAARLEGRTERPRAGHDASGRVVHLHGGRQRPLLLHADRQNALALSPTTGERGPLGPSRPACMTGRGGCARSGASSHPRCCTCRACP